MPRVSLTPLVALSILVTLATVVCARPPVSRPARPPKHPLMLTGGRGKNDPRGEREIFEGRRVITDADSYPREPASIVKGPDVARDGDGFTISFTLDKPDDVLVGIVDPQGNTVRTLASGMLGWNAPEPLAIDTLSQTIRWDGTDDAGQSAPSGCRVRVAVGLTPRWDGFVAYDPAQTLPRLSCLEVDHKGRVYVGAETAKRWDPNILRFDRDGTFVDTFYPPNPNHMPGGKPEDAITRCDYVDGKAVPYRRGYWPGIIRQAKNLERRFFPLRITPDGKAYVVQINPVVASQGIMGTTWVGPEGVKKAREALGIRSLGVGKDIKSVRLMHPQLDPPWFLQYMNAVTGPWTLDAAGKHAYICYGNTAGKPVILKIDMETLAPVAQFDRNGEEERTEKKAFIGTSDVKMVSKRRPYTSVGKYVSGLAVDAGGHIYVVCRAMDGNAGTLHTEPPEMRVFAPDGTLVRTIREVTIDGASQPLGAVSGIHVVKDTMYLVTRSEPIMTGRRNSISGWKKARVLKLAVSPGAELKVIWAVPLDASAEFVAVDGGVAPPLVWVGNGGGPATLTRIVDAGAKPSEVRHCLRGIAPGVLVDPWAVAVDGEGRVFTFDHARDAIVRTNDNGSDWAESEPLNLEIPVKRLYIDRVRKRLYASPDRTRRSKIACYDLDLKPHKDGLPALRSAVANVGFSMGACDDEGNLYVGDHTYNGAGPFLPEDLSGHISLLGPGGEMKEEAVCKVFCYPGGIARDSKGSFYTTDVCRTNWRNAAHDMPGAHWTRAGKRIYSHAEVSYLVKFPPTGGVRGTDTELWAHRGISPAAGGCRCTIVTNVLAIDDADRVFAVNYLKYHVKVLDTEGNLITRIGEWGSADCMGPDSAFPKPEIAFFWVHSIAVRGDVLYAGDRATRRITRIRMTYRETKEADVPG